jgi:hypothetical protein
MLVNTIEVWVNFIKYIIYYKFQIFSSLKCHIPFPLLKWQFLIFTQLTFPWDKSKEVKTNLEIPKKGNTKKWKSSELGTKAPLRKQKEIWIQTIQFFFTEYTSYLKPQNVENTYQITIFVCYAYITQKVSANNK